MGAAGVCVAAVDASDVAEVREAAAREDAAQRRRASAAAHPPPPPEPEPDVSATFGRMRVIVDAVHAARREGG